MSMLLTIRRAVAADIPDLHRLQHGSMRELDLGFDDAEVIEAFIAHVGTLDARLVDDGTYFVATIGARLVGCGGWSPRPPSYAATDDGDNMLADEASVHGIFVHPVFVRNGIARRLMTEIEADIVAAGRKRACLAVTLAGVPFFRRLGYRNVTSLTLRLPPDLTFVGIKMCKALKGGVCSAA